MDNHLNDKYRHDRLTPEELKAWKKQVAAMEEHEMKQLIAPSWFDEEPTEATDSDDRVNALKERIDRDLSTNGRKPKASLAKRIALIAASFLIPILLASTYYFYHESRQAFDNRITVATNKGEQATVVLPDGSIASLNYNSRLSYYAHDFNHRERSITFDGHARFEVAKMADCPFNIHMHELQVHVLGTKFYLDARQDRDMARLTLEEGLVKLTALKTNKEAFVHPGETATLCYATGEIKVSRQHAESTLQALRSNLLVCDGQALSRILPELEDAYRMRFFVHTDKPLGTFTGKLPLDNLMESIRIIAATYRLNYTIEGNDVHFNPIKK